MAEVFFCALLELHVGIDCPWLDTGYWRCRSPLHVRIANCLARGKMTASDRPQMVVVVVVAGEFTQGRAFPYAEHNFIDWLNSLSTLPRKNNYKWSLFFLAAIMDYSLTNKNLSALFPLAINEKIFLWQSGLEVWLQTTWPLDDLCQDYDNVIRTRQTHRPLDRFTQVSLR